MKFRVVWLPEALDELTTIWTQDDSPSRRAITEATEAIDQQLAANPYRQSESRDDEDRVLFVYPLGIHIEIDLDQRLVRILNVWRFRRRGQ